MYKKVLIGVIRYTPRKQLEGTHCRHPETGEWIPAQYIPAQHSWEESEHVKYKEGLLYGFFTEADSDGEKIVVGLVEHSDGTFDTYAVQCLKFEYPTPAIK